MPYLLRHLNHAFVIEIQARDRVIGFWLRGLFLHGNDLSVFVKFHDAEALGVVHIIAEYRSASVFGVFHRRAQQLGKAVAVKNVVAQHHGAWLVPDECIPQNERLRQAVRRGLHLVRQLHAELASVVQQRFKTGRVLYFDYRNAGEKSDTHVK